MEFAINIPPCAMVVDQRTVLVRIGSRCRGSGSADARRDAAAADTPSRISGCDCSRIREEYSGCDSGVVVGSRCRRYRSTAAWRRYVKVSAAVCLLLFFGGLPRQAAAGPAGLRSTRNMDPKQWENPCDYISMNEDISYEPELARKAANQAQITKAESESYKAEFAQKTHSYDSFEKLVNEWQSYEWLRTFAWVKQTQQSFPAAKVYAQSVPDDEIQEVVQESVINSVLPAMYKNLQMLVASFSVMPDALAEPAALNELIPHVTNTKQLLRSVLCLLFDVLSSRGLAPETITINLEDIPDFTNSSQSKNVLLLLVYRDTLSYLEYLQQVLQAMAEKKV